MPSGPKKRKAAKKKMEYVAVSTTIQQGNGGSESGSDAASPMSPDIDLFNGKEVGGGGGEHGSGGGLSGDVESSLNGGGKATGEQPVALEKMKEVLPVSLVSESAAMQPVSQPEDVCVEHVEPAKDVVVGDSGKEIKIPAKKDVVVGDSGEEIEIPATKDVVVGDSGVEIEIPATKDVVVGDSGVEIMVPTKVVAEEKLENSVSCVEVPAATSVQPIPISEGKEVAARVDDVLVEKVEGSSSPLPPSDKQEGKVEGSSSLQPPSEEKEEKIEVLGSGQPPSDEIEQKPEGSSSLESPSDAKEQKVASLSDRISTKQPAESGVQHLQKGNRDIGTDVVLPPQAVQRTSWLSCCGLFDAFTSSNR